MKAFGEYVRLSISLILLVPFLGHFCRISLQRSTLIIHCQQRYRLSAGSFLHLLRQQLSLDGSRIEGRVLSYCVAWLLYGSNHNAKSWTNTSY